VIVKCVCKMCSNVNASFDLPKQRVKFKAWLIGNHNTEGTINGELYNGIDEAKALYFKFMKGVEPQTIRTGEEWKALALWLLELHTKQKHEIIKPDNDENESPCDDCSRECECSDCEYGGN